MSPRASPSKPAGSPQQHAQSTAPAARCGGTDAAHAYYDDDDEIPTDDEDDDADDFLMLALKEQIRQCKQRLRGIEQQQRARP